MLGGGAGTVEDTVLNQGLPPKRYNLLKETFILSHDFSRLGSWLPGPMSFTEHSGRNMWVSDQEGVGGTRGHTSGFVHILFFLGYQIIRWCCSLSRCLFPSVTAPRIHRFWKGPLIFTQRCHSLALDSFQSSTLTKQAARVS